MSSPLDGRVAIITGTSSGIGRAIAAKFVAAGATVHGFSRRGESEPGVRVHVVDITNDMAVAREVEAVGEDRGVHILVLAAGLQTPERRLEQLTPAIFDELINANLTGAFHMVAAALPYLRTARGDVIFVSSASALWPDLSGPAYQAAKLGLAGLSRAAAVEEHMNGIRFSTIYPGMTETPMLDLRPTPISEEIREHALAPEDVAELCLFMAMLRPGVSIPEVTIMPSLIQAPGKAPSSPPPARPS
ncbi:MAG: SDR family oxidoreductase [Actinomycetota bacterium]